MQNLILLALQIGFLVFRVTMFRFKNNRLLAHGCTGGPSHCVDRRLCCADTGPDTSSDEGDYGAAWNCAYRSTSGASSCFCNSVRNRDVTPPPILPPSLLPSLPACAPLLSSARDEHGTMSRRTCFKNGCIRGPVQGHVNHSGS